VRKSAMINEYPSMHDTETYSIQTQEQHKITRIKRSKLFLNVSCW